MKIFDKLKNREKRNKNNKIVFSVYLALRVIVIGLLVYGIVRQNFQTAFYCILTLCLFLLPDFAEHKFKIKLPTALEIIIILFIFAAEILGELQCYYVKFSHWDTMLHTINGFLCAAVGFALVDMLNRNSRFEIKLSPAFLALVAFCFSMTVGVLWEFYEFGCDVFFKTDMQKDTVINSISSVMLDPSKSNTPVIIDDISQVMVNGKELGLNGYLDIGLIDTMKDLLVNFLGAMIFSIIGYINVKCDGKSRIAKSFIPEVERNFEEDKENT